MKPFVRFLVDNVDAKITLMEQNVKSVKKDILEKMFVNVSSLR